MDFQPKCAATAVGSMPHTDPERAVAVVLDAIPNAPTWPQLPKRNLREQMEIQYSEGMPRIVIDEKKQRMYFDTTGDYSEDLATFYEAYMQCEETGDCSALALTPEFAAAFGVLEAKLKGGKRPIVKCQTTGPISFALTIVDENKRAIFYNDEFVDVVVKGIAMKCRWQLQKLKGYGERAICFLDEPILAGFGSSTYVSVQRDDVVAKLNEVVEAIHAEGAIAGIHCCGNTEWSIPIDAGAEIVNFDAYEFGETVALYPDHMKKHLVENKNALAWGVIPTSARIREESADSLVARFEKLTDNLAEKSGVEKQTIIEQAFITPSCGTGSIPVEDAERVHVLLRETSEALRKKHGFA
ncbi:MAG: uroporphyrinogen decarboxylase/cobalamine-independent methonine synthase family protein [Planctomycetota bacterium]|jgi:hypothetical protein